MKNLLIIAAISLGTMAPCFAQAPFLRSYDEQHKAQQREIMRTWNVVGTPQPFLRSYDEQHAAQQKEIMHTWNAVDTAPEFLKGSSSYDELQQAEQKKIIRTWNAIEVVRGTTAPAGPVEGVSRGYLEQNREQIKMNTAINEAIEF